jgi:hypothetical protein
MLFKKEEQDVYYRYYDSKSAAKHDFMYVMVDKFTEKDQDACIYRCYSQNFNRLKVIGGDAPRLMISIHQENIKDGKMRPIKEQKELCKFMLAAERVF